MALGIVIGATAMNAAPNESAASPRTTNVHQPRRHAGVVASRIAQRIMSARDAAGSSAASGQWNNMRRPAACTFRELC